MRFLNPMCSITSLLQAFLFSCIMVVGCECPPIVFPAHIVFDSNRDTDPAKSQIYIMDVDGSNVKRLTNNEFTDRQAALSAVGLKIAFRSNRSGTDEIWIMNGDGSGPVQLTRLGGVARPRFNDGNLLAFSAAGPGDAAPDIYTIRSDGADLKRLTTNSANDIEPFFSPDGKKIVFTSTRNGSSDIYIMDTDGSHQTQLTFTTSSDAMPSFSPDGTKIAFWSNRNGKSEIYIMNIDGTGQVSVTNNGARNFEPAFSSNTNEITFSSDIHGNTEIYVINTDGTNLRRLTTNPAHDDAPDWK